MDVLESGFPHDWFMQASAGISLTPLGKTTSCSAAFTVNSVPCIGTQKSFCFFQVMLGQRNFSETSEVNICPSTSQNYLTQMLPPLCGRNPLSSQNQMPSWDFFSVSLFSARKGTLGGSLDHQLYTLIISLPIPGTYCHLLSKLQGPQILCFYGTSFLPQILSVTRILSFP